MFTKGSSNRRLSNQTRVETRRLRGISIFRVGGSSPEQITGALRPRTIFPAPRSKLTAKEMLRALYEIDCAAGIQGAISAIMWLDELYSRATTDWRRQREAWVYAGLSLINRGLNILYWLAAAHPGWAWPRRMESGASGGRSCHPVSRHAGGTPFGEDGTKPLYLGFYHHIACRDRGKRYRPWARNKRRISDIYGGYTVSSEV